MTHQPDRVAQVVAWLNSPARKKLISLPDKVIPAYWETDHFGNRIAWRAEERRKVYRLPTAKDYADAIEAGEPFKETPDE